MSGYLDIVFSIFLGSLLLAAIIGMNVDLNERNSINNIVLSVQQTAVDIKSIIRADLKAIGAGVSDSVDCFIIADSTQIKFRTDIGFDGSINEIHYYTGETASASATENPADRILYRKIDNNTPEDYSTGLINMQFTYFDENGDTTLSLTDINQIKLSFLLENRFSYNGKYPGMYIEERVYPKNLIRE